MWLWRRRQSRTALWAALTFAVLAIVVDAGRFVPEDPQTLGGELAIRVLIGLLVLFPYLLYRFSGSFAPAPRSLERVVGLMTAIMLVWTFALPEVPADDEARSLGFQLYLAAFLVHWSVLTIVVAVRLWRGGRGQPSVARKRVRFLAAAAVLLTVALLLAAFVGGDDGSASELVTSLLTMVSALAFLLGLVPPAALRAVWRRPEQERLGDAIAELITASSEREVAACVLPAMSDIVGAHAVALVDRTGRLIDSHGADDEVLADAARRGHVVDVAMPGGALRVWRSPYAPFFGDEELRLLRSLGALTGLALDHARLFAQERLAREALQRADEVKTQFVALAAHELRTPVASLRGFAETIEYRRDQLLPEQLERLETTLFEQIRRTADLVEQLLDLSRLDAEAIAVEPRPLEIAPILEGTVRTAAGERAPEVAVEVDPRLRAVVDESVLERVVSNLVVNALRYGEAPVLVRAVQSDRHFRVVVEDAGAGVDPQFVPRLFERFTRSVGGGRPKTGSGLGLAIARSYARAHGGELFYEPATPHGARFELVLPARPLEQQ